MSKIKINESCYSWHYSIKNIRKIKRCGCWQSEQNIKQNHMPYSRMCRKHKFLHALKFTMKEQSMDLWRLRCFFKYDLKKG